MTNSGVLTKDLLLGIISYKMITASISQLKINPSSLIAQAVDYPVAVEKRNKIQAYLIGKSLYERMLDLLEDHLDRLVIKSTNFRKGKDFEKIAKDLGI